VRERQVNRK